MSESPGPRATIELLLFAVQTQQPAVVQTPLQTWSPLGGDRSQQRSRVWDVLLPKSSSVMHELVPSSQGQAVAAAYPQSPMGHHGWLPTVLFLRIWPFAWALRSVLDLLTGTSPVPRQSQLALRVSDIHPHGINSVFFFTLRPAPSPHPFYQIMTVSWRIRRTLAVCKLGSFHMKAAYGRLLPRLRSRKKHLPDIPQSTHLFQLAAFFTPLKSQ